MNPDKRRQGQPLWLRQGVDKHRPCKALSWRMAIPYEDRSNATGSWANTSPSDSRFPLSEARARTLSPVKTFAHSKGAELGGSSALSAQTVWPAGNRPGGANCVTNLDTAVIAQARFERRTNENTFSRLGPMACKGW